MKFTSKEPVIKGGAAVLRGSRPQRSSGFSCQGYRGIFQQSVWTGAAYPAGKAALAVK